MSDFSCKTHIICGHGTIARLADYGAQRLFLVTDPYFHQNGTAARVAKVAKAQQVAIFHEIQPDPTVELAATGTARLREFGPDLIVALGGGSAMDCAKAMAYFSGLEIPLVAIPTTSGSGSEVTDFAILTHGGIKHPLVDPKLQPSGAILDGDLLAELPPSLVADGGFDVLTHALEAFIAKNANPITNALSRDAFSLVFRDLRGSFQGQTSVRLGIHQAATMAGMAFSQAGLGLCHAMAHSLGGLFHIPHGRLNAILLPSVIRCNAHTSAEQYRDLARAAGMEASSCRMGVRNLENGLIRLRRELNMPQTLLQAGADPRQVRALESEILRATLADPCCTTNPVTVTEEMVRQVLSEVTGHGTNP